MWGCHVCCFLAAYEVLHSFCVFEQDLLQQICFVVVSVCGRTRFSWARTLLEPFVRMRRTSGETNWPTIDGLKMVLISDTNKAKFRFEFLRVARDFANTCTSGYHGSRLPCSECWCHHKHVSLQTLTKCFLLRFKTKQNATFSELKRDKDSFPRWWPGPSTNSGSRTLTLFWILLTSSAVQELHNTSGL